MGKKGRKTRWRKLPIPIGNGTCSGDTKSGRYEISRGGWEDNETEEPKRQHQPPQTVSPSTFNEDEYTRITTPRQDMLFKKGYLGKKKTSAPPQDMTDTQSAGDSVESESYVCDETANQYMYPGGYVDPTGVYYMNNGYEMYDPYTGAVTVIVGPGPQYGNGPGVLTAVPCAPLPLQPLEWFNPAVPQPPFALPPTYLHRKKRSSIDSQNCSGQSSETTCNPGSPPEPMEGVSDASGQAMYPAQYVYPGAYMFGAPLYNMNGVSVQGLVPPCAPPPADQAKRRKKRRRRRRGGALTDEGSESSCEEVMGSEAGNESQSGASSDTALGSSSSKTNSDSGIHTDLTANSGSDSPQILESTYYCPISPTENLVEVLNPPVEQVPSTESPQMEVAECSIEEQAELNCIPNEPVEMVIQYCDEVPVTLSAQTCDDVQNETPNCAVELENTDEDKIDQTSVVGDEEGNFNETCLQEAVVPSAMREVKIEIVSEEEQCTSDFTSTPTSPQTPAEDYYTSDETEPTPLSPTFESSEPDVANEQVHNDEAVLLVASLDVDTAEAQGTVEEIAELCSKIEDNLYFEAGEVKTAEDLCSESSSNEEVSWENPISNDIKEEKVGSPARPITQAVTKWLESQGSGALSGSALAEEEGEDPLTGSKNAEGNPFLASSPNARTRVAKNDSDTDRVTKMCDPKASVEKYYRLAAETTSPDRSSPLVTKTVHLGRSGPFPCGICCILQ